MSYKGFIVQDTDLIIDPASTLTEKAEYIVSSVTKNDTNFITGNPVSNNFMNIIASGQPTVDSPLDIATVTGGIPGKDARFVWSEDGQVTWNSFESYTAASGFTLIKNESGNEISNPVGINLKTGKALIAYSKEEASVYKTIQLAYVNPDSWTTSSFIEIIRVSKLPNETFSLFPQLVQLNNGRVICYYVEYDQQNITPSYYYSDDNGVTWNNGNSCIDNPLSLDLTAGDKVLDFIVTSSNSEVLMILNILDGASGLSTLRQYGSFDNGAKFQLISSLEQVSPSAYAVGYRNISATWNGSSFFLSYGRMEAAGDPDCLLMISSISSVSQPFWNSSIYSYRFLYSSVQYNVVGTNDEGFTNIVCDDAGILTVYCGNENGYVDTGVTDPLTTYSSIFLSKDGGKTWYSHLITKSFFDDTVKIPDTASSFYRYGKILMLFSNETNKEGLYSIFFGGYTNVPIPKISHANNISSEDGIEAGKSEGVLDNCWFKNYYGFGNYPSTWTNIIAGSPSLTRSTTLFGGSYFNTGAGESAYFTNTSYQVATPFIDIEINGASHGYFEQIARFSLYVEAGTFVHILTSTNTDTSRYSKLNITVNNSGIAITDGITGTSKGSQTVSGFIDVLVAHKGTTFKVWYRQFNLSNKEWIEIDDGTALSTAAITTQVQECRWGINANSDVFLLEHHLSWETDILSILAPTQLYCGLIPEFSLVNSGSNTYRGRYLPSNTPTYVTNDIFILGASGSTVRGESWTINLTSTAAKEKMLAEYPSPQEQWISADESADQDLLLCKNSDFTYTTTHARTNALYGFAFINTNINAGEIQYHDGTVWNTWADIINEIPITCTVVGRTVKMNSGSSISDSAYIKADEAVGWTFVDSAGNAFLISSNTDGHLVNNSSAKTPTFTLIGEANAGSQVGYLIPKTFYITANMPSDYSGIRIVVNSGGTSKATSEGYYYIGRLVYGDLQILGKDTDYSASTSYIPGFSLSTFRTGKRIKKSNSSYRKTMNIKFQQESAPSYKYVAGKLYDSSVIATPDNSSELVADMVRKANGDPFCFINYIEESSDAIMYWPMLDDFIYGRVSGEVGKTIIRHMDRESDIATAKDITIEEEL